MNEPVITMSHSDDLTKFAPAFIKAQANMGAVIKDNTANIPMKSGGKYSYKYADLGSVLDAAVPALQSQGIAVIQGPLTIDGQTGCETLFLHESGQWVKSCLLLPLASRDAQAAGSAVTYSRRYALLAMAGLSAEDDDGAAATRPAEGPRMAQDARKPAIPGIDPNALLLDAVRSGFIPSADRLMFKEWARTLPGCQGIEDKAPLTEAHLQAIKSFLSKPRAVPEVLRRAQELADEAPLSLADAEKLF